MKYTNRGNITLFVVIAIIIISAFFITGGLFTYKYSNPDTNGAFIPLSPTPHKKDESLQIHVFPFLFLTPTPTPNASGTGTNAQCPISVPNNITSITSTLSKNFGIQLTGSDVSLARADDVFSTVCLLFQSKMYSHWLNSLNNPIPVDLEPGNCFGHASAISGIVLYGACGGFIDRFTTTHELGHMVAFRNPNLYNDYLSHVWPQTLPTWDCQLDYGPGPWPGECFADMMGEYLVYPQWRESVGGAPPGPSTLSDYPTTYSSYYNFARDKIFGGITYF